MNHTYLSDRLKMMLQKMLLKLTTCLATTRGWIGFATLGLINFLAGHTFIINMVVFVTIMDAVWGISVSIKRHRFALSELARNTIGKLLVYGCVMIAFIGIDKWIETDITASIIGSAIVLIELWSSAASMIILFPDFLFLRIFRKMLLGEIARKLNVEEAEVEDMLKK